MEFRKLQLEDKPFFDSYLSKWHMGHAESSFSNLYIWRNPWDTRFAEQDGVLYIGMNHEQGGIGPLLLAPVPFDRNMDYRKALAPAHDYFKQIGRPFKLQGVTCDIADKIRQIGDERYEFALEPDFAEYVYLVSDLIDLPGRRYHGKRNNISKFLRDNPTAEFSLMKKDDIDECWELYNLWLSKKSESEEFHVYDEVDAIQSALYNMDYLQMKGGVVRIEGKVEAFTLGDRSLPEMAHIHIEKANPEYPGLYQYINREFLAAAWSDCTYVNREEDMGIPGLKRAKESYYPVTMLQKHLITYRGEE